MAVFQIKVFCFLFPLKHLFLPFMTVWNPVNQVWTTPSLAFKGYEVSLARVHPQVTAHKLTTTGSTPRVWGVSRQGQHNTIEAYKEKSVFLD